MIPFSRLDATSDHRAHEQTDRLLRDTLGDLAERLGAPTPLVESAKKKSFDDDGRLWSLDKPALSGDLHARMRTMLEGGDPRGDNAPEGGYPFAPIRTRLTAAACNVLTGRVGARGSWCFHVPIRKRARQRLASRGVELESLELPLKLKGAVLLSAATGVGALTFELELKPIGDQPLSPWLLIEAVHVLKRRFATHPALRWGDAAPSSDDIGVTIHALADALVPGLWTGQGPEARRTFSYAALSIDRGLDRNALTELAFRMSRGYTEDYLPTSGELGRGLVQPFENVAHLTALEGGATVVVSDGQVPFLENFVRDAVPRAYLPICQAAFLEHVFLRQMYGDIRFRVPAPDAIDASTTAELSRFLARLLDFRLNHRFHHASDVTMHNQVYSAWRRSLALESIATEVGQDVEDVAAFLADVAKAREERQSRHYERARRRTSRIQTALGIFVGGMVFLTGFFGMNFRSITGETSNIDADAHWVWFVVGATAILSGLGAAFFTVLTREQPEAE